MLLLAVKPKYNENFVQGNTNRQSPNQSIVRSRSFTFGTSTSGNGGVQAAASSSFGYGTYGATSPVGYGGTSPGYAGYTSGQLSSGGRSHGYHSSGGRHSSGRRSYEKVSPNSDDLSAYYGTPSPYDPAENAEILSELKRYRMREMELF